VAAEEEVIIILDLEDLVDLVVEGVKAILILQEQELLVKVMMVVMMLQVQHQNLVLVAAEQDKLDLMR
jgi:hypothetical protein